MTEKNISNQTSSTEEALSSFLDVMPARVKNVITSFSHLHADLEHHDANTIFLYWTWAITRYPLFQTPEFFEEDIKGGARKMLGRCLYEDDRLAGKSLVKVVRKINPQGDWSLRKRDVVLWAIQNESIMQSLRHAERINIKLLTTLKRYINTKGVVFSRSKYVHRLFLEESGGTNQGNELDQDLYEIVALFKDTIQMIRMLELEKEYLHVLVSMRTMEELLRLHDNIIELFNDGRFEDMISRNNDGTDRFPEPPMKGEEWIVPIENQDVLRYEGRYMHHCIASSSKRIKRGERYVYRVLKPQRGTLAIDPITLKIQEFKIKYNKEPSDESWKKVHVWLTEHQMKHIHKAAA